MVCRAFLTINFKPDACTVSYVGGNDMLKCLNNVRPVSWNSIESMAACQYLYLHNVSTWFYIHSFVFLVKVPL